jgi:protein TonB
MAGRKNKKGPPRRDMLLPGFLIFFVGVHLMALHHFGDRFRTHGTQVIELSLTQGYQPIDRQIPRPPQSPQSALDSLPMPPKPVAPPKPPPMRRPIACAPLQRLPSAATSVAAAPRDRSAAQADHAPSSRDLLRHYFESVRSKINAHKIYPKSARKRRQEGSVEVRFVISRSGRVTAVQVVGGATYALLRRAATEAIRCAAPFPPLPGSLGKDRISTRITMHFKLGASGL